jgi:DNA-directed RNA polymerase specialized sigma24 family protein
VIVDEEAYLAHYGVLRKSGRYPWGSGGPEYASNKGFIGYEAQLKKQGLSEVERARAMGITTSQLRAAKAIAKNEEKAAQISQATRLREHGYGASEIGRKMGLPEATVRGLLATGAADKSTQLEATANALKDAVDRKQYIDIGSGTEHYIGVSDTTLKNAVARLKEEGYEVHNVKIDQLGTGKKTEFKVLCPPGSTQKELWQNRDKITQYMDVQSTDGGRSFLGLQKPLSISSKRVGINYAEDGGAKADGVIYVRPGVKDLSMGAARYAQVRIAVDGSHYLKGMAIYKDDLPDGVDLVFNTNKSNTGNKLDAMKKLTKDEENPFGSLVRQRLDEKTGKVTSALNIVGIKEGAGEEGAWDRWANSLSSQFLSKQAPTLAKAQLDEAYLRRRADLDEIKSLTNPAVKKKLLESYADGADSAAWHLKAAALPRQRNQVILPVNSLKPTEVYAPNFRDGERVVLVRFPHGGTFEIPELTVNNKNPEARKLLGAQAKDAIGIHHKVAEQLSGADFDGDTVLVIPNNSGKVKSKPAIQALIDFDPKHAYPKYDGMQVMKPKTKGIEMGKISNLITDMTIKGAPDSELIRAVKHSMVVIDAEKHQLNYKQSYIDQGIAALQKKYQTADSASGKPGAATIISRRKREDDIPDRVLRKASQGGPIDPATGKLVYVNTGAMTTQRKVDKRTGEVTTNIVPKTIKVGRLANAENAHDLSTGVKIESIYADHSNQMKALANEARREYVGVKGIVSSPSAKKAFSDEVKSLSAKLTLAERNRPLERQAQLLANTQYAMRRQANPDMEPAEIKKIKAQLLNEARRRLGASKPLIEIEPNEWAAIQAGAISNKRLEDILNNADLDRVRELATPKAKAKMTTVKTNRAKALLASGHPQSEVADALGVSLSTLKTALANDN